MTESKRDKRAGETNSRVSASYTGNADLMCLLAFVMWLLVPIAAWLGVVYGR